MKMNSLNQHIIEFLDTKPSNKIIFSRQTDGGIDLGKELSNHIKPYLEHQRLSMKTKDFIDELFKTNIKSSDEIGKYIAIKNLGILFEPELKINFEHFLKTYSSDITLIIQWPGEISSNHLFFLSKEKGLQADLKNLTYTNHEV
jgi:hypothetical protein